MFVCLGLQRKALGRSPDWKLADQRFRAYQIELGCDPRGAAPEQSPPSTSESDGRARRSFSAYLMQQTLNQRQSRGGRHGRGRQPAEQKHPGCTARPAMVLYSSATVKVGMDSGFSLQSGGSSSAGGSRHDSWGHSRVRRGDRDRLAPTALTVRPQAPVLAPAEAMANATVGGATVGSATARAAQPAAGGVDDGAAAAAPAAAAILPPPEQKPHVSRALFGNPQGIAALQQPLLLARSK